MEELTDTNEGYRHHGREVVEKNLSSPNNSEKSTLSRTKYRTSGIEMRKATYIGSDDGGDKDPPKKNIEKSHTVYTSVKIKINTQTTWLTVPETQESP
jgi:hypothetical protein